MVPHCSQAFAASTKLRKLGAESSVSSRFFFRGVSKCQAHGKYSARVCLRMTCCVPTCALTVAIYFSMVVTRLSCRHIMEWFFRFPSWPPPLLPFLLPPSGPSFLPSFLPCSWSQHHCASSAFSVLHPRGRRILFLLCSNALGAPKRKRPEEGFWAPQQVDMPAKVSLRCHGLGQVATDGITFAARGASLWVAGRFNSPFELELAFTWGPGAFRLEIGPSLALRKGGTVAPADNFTVDSPWWLARHYRCRF